MRTRTPGRLLAAVTWAIWSGGACAGEKTAAPPRAPVSHYAAPIRAPGADGSASRPWDLPTALAGGGGQMLPGDTLWLRGGTYRGSFRTDLQGTPAARLTIRQYPGERATIDGTLRAEGSYLTFWGFEVMQSNPDSANYVLQAYTTAGRFINLVLHDAGISGVSMSTTSGADMELYGCVIYNNGTHENLDHGIYAHNTTATVKHITDNVLFNNYARGLQIYEGGDSLIRNFDVTGNVYFNNGSISSAASPINLLISAPAATSGIVAVENMVYSSPGLDGIGLRIGNYGAAYNRDIVLRNNYAAGGRIALQMAYAWDRATVQNNVLLASTDDEVHTGGANLGAVYQWADNVYYRDPAALAWRHDSTDYSFAAWKAATGLGSSDQATAALPTSPQVFLRPNKYEPGRANIVVYNWDRRGEVAVDMSTVLRAGDRYEVRNVQDMFGTPVTVGTYAGGAVAIPMTGVQPPAPIGRTTPRAAPSTAPDFDVFIVTSTRPSP